MIKYKYIGETYLLPESFRDIKMDVFCENLPYIFDCIDKRLELNEFDSIEFQSKILGIDYDVLYNMPIEISTRINFIKELVDLGSILSSQPKKIIIPGYGKLKLSKDLKDYNIIHGQLEFAGNIYTQCSNKFRSEEVNEVLQKFAGEIELDKHEVKIYETYNQNVLIECLKRSSEFAAIFIQSKLGKFDKDRIIELSNKFDKMPFIDILPLAFFFLNRINGIQTFQTMYCLAQKSLDYLMRQKIISQKN